MERTTSAKSGSRWAGGCRHLTTQHKTPSSPLTAPKIKLPLLRNQPLLQPTPFNTDQAESSHFQPLFQQQQPAMPNLSARWTRLVSSERLERSSQSLAVLQSRAWVFGGELLPREPVDNRIDVIDLRPGQGTCDAGIFFDWLLIIID